MANNYLITILFFFLIAIHSCGKEEWSPHTAPVLFMSNREGNAEIYLKQGNDTTWVNLTNHEAGDNWATWSPDGERILFQSTRSGNLDIWIMNKDGSHPIQLTDDKDYDYLPSFTPDGKRINFTTWRVENEYEERAPHIYMMNADGTNQHRLIEESMKTSAGASWHPDGSKFLFTKKNGEKGANIFEADKEGNLIRQITDDTLYSGGAEYSPDGIQIIYTQDYGDSTDVMLMKTDGRNATVLLAGEKNYYPHFSPDGQWIIYTKLIPNSNDQNLDIFAISLENPSNQILIAGGLHREAEGVWRFND